ncbi:MAG: hypothetical protein K0R31_796 [Clostridiales bacterium]|jgi:hypothetical protein|nr:hypothetical protein [Clostridiales bacterium]
MGEVARYYGCPFIDLYHLSGFNALSMPIFTTDGANLTPAGGNRIAEIIVNELLKIQPLY